VKEMALESDLIESEDIVDEQDDFLEDVDMEADFMFAVGDGGGLGGP
jgi:hypothetical protein